MCPYAWGAMEKGKGETLQFPVMHFTMHTWAKASSFH